MTSLKERQPTAAYVVTKPAECPLCGCPAKPVYPGLRAALRTDGRLFGYHDCADCGLLFADPLPDDGELRHLYQERYDFEWFRQRRWLKRLQAWHRAWRLRALWRRLGNPAAVPRFLDVGCGHGWLVEAVRKSGWKASGLDFLSAEQMERCRRLGLDLHSCSLQEHPFAAGSFDLISLWHVLEHSNDPRGMLNLAASLLSHEGLLVLAVPNRESLGLARTGEQWGWLQKPFIHPFCFSSRALKAILPDSLQPVLITSRDTWDQQFAQDSRAVKWIGKLNHIVFRGARKVALVVRMRPVARLLERAHFWAEQLVLLATYACYLVARRYGWLHRNYEQALKASELMMVCRRVSPDGPVSLASLTKQL